MIHRFSYILILFAILFFGKTSLSAQEIMPEENTNPVILYSSSPK